jgi:small-conductance mechanosensitive channel
MLEINELTMSLSELMTPIILILLSFLITLWIKDFLTKIAKGAMFKMSGTFREGDKVLIDNEIAIIVKIGITYTVFGITKNDNQYYWRYVPNEKITSLKIEKQIFK